MQGAFWELYLHELLSRQGFAITCHPVLPDTGNSPDFLAVRSDGSFSLEATTVRDADKDIKKDRVRRQVYDALNQLQMPGLRSRSMWTAKAPRPSRVVLSARG